MNREILFRGKRIDNKEWVEGYYVPIANSLYLIYTDKFGITRDGIYLDQIPVFSETVGRFTGLIDKNGRKIFEEDILKRGSHKYVVKWCDDCAMFVLPCITDKKLESDFTVFYDYDFEIIGNVHDDPELLGGENNA